MKKHKLLMLFAAVLMLLCGQSANAAIKLTALSGLKLSRKNIAENLCEATTTFNIPLYLEWNIDSYIYI